MTPAEDAATCTDHARLRRFAVVEPSAVLKNPYLPLLALDDWSLYVTVVAVARYCAAKRRIEGLRQPERPWSKADWHMIQQRTEGAANRSGHPHGSPLWRMAEAEWLETIADSLDPASATYSEGVRRADGYWAEAQARRTG